MKDMNEIANILVKDVFAIKENEKIIVTVDKGSEREVMSQIINVAYMNKAEALIVEIPEPDTPCSGVDPYVSSDIERLLQGANCWLDAGSKPWIYSSAFENAFEKNKDLRYMVIGGIDANGMMKLFGGLDVGMLKKQASRIKSTIRQGKKMTFKCAKGTSFEACLNHGHFLASDIGDASFPGFHTPPALINIVPEFGSVNGVFALSALMLDEKWTVLDSAMKIYMKDSKIVNLEGKSEYVEALKNWLKKGDDVSDLFAHISIGLSPNIKEIQGDVLYDERIYGALNCGFGHVSPMDAPPLGQASKTHFDSITEKVSIWVDDVPLMIDGELKLKG